MRYRWFDKEEKRRYLNDALRENLREQYGLNSPRKISRGEFSGLLLAIVALCYGYAVDDLPLMFAATSLIVFFARPLAYHFAGARGKSVANAMQGFSIALFLGALAMILI